MSERRHNQGSLNETFNPWKVATNIRGAAAFQVQLESSIALANSGLTKISRKGKPLDPEMARILLEKGLSNIGQLIERSGDFDFADKPRLMEEAQKLLADYLQRTDSTKTS